jgi:hypothetical protein
MWSCGHFLFSVKYRLLKMDVWFFRQCLNFIELVDKDPRLNVLSRLTANVESPWTLYLLRQLQSCFQVFKRFLQEKV